MINLRNYEQLQKWTTLKETSKNSPNKATVIYMVESDFEVIDFDEVKNCYISELGVKVLETPKSNDALFELNGELYFVEFKDGNMQKEIHNVKRKIYDSLLIFCDIVKENISFTRQHMNYILVYNKEKSEEYIKSIIKKSEKQPKQLDKTEQNDTPSFDDFVENMKELSDSELDIFGLEKQFKNLYFKNVFTYNKERFIEKFVNQLPSNIS